MFFPILWTYPVQLQDRSRRDQRAVEFLFVRLDDGKFRSGSGAIGLLQALLELGDHRVGLDVPWLDHRDPSRLVDGLSCQSKRTKDILMWMLSTKMLPPVGVLIPIYLIFRELGLLDSRIGLTFVLMLINLPIIVWMLYTYFKEIPGEILEAARMDGASLREEIIYVLTPMAIPGIASTLLLNIILAWNEAFWTLNLTAAKRRR